LWDEYTSSDYYSSLSAEDSGIAKFIAQNIIPNQTRYFFFVLAFARLSWAHSSLLYSFKSGSINKSAKLNFFERACLVVHWTVFCAVTYFWIDSAINRALFFIVSQATTGYALALVFALNHSGMPVISEEKAEEMEFFEIQVITGRDVKNGLLGDWFCGGLNYQIEHHVSVWILEITLYALGHSKLIELPSIDFPQHASPQLEEGPAQGYRDVQETQCSIPPYRFLEGNFGSLADFGHCPKGFCQVEQEGILDEL
jgi:hypothetical protein